eukprot:6346878-Amphidinium_carterae.3
MELAGYCPASCVVCAAREVEKGGTLAGPAREVCSAQSNLGGARSTSHMAFSIPSSPSLECALVEIPLHFPVANVSGAAQA